MANEEKHDPCCKGCDISDLATGKKNPADMCDRPIGDAIYLKDRWALNHYQGKEGFFGWMTMQPLRHCMDFTKLNKPEVRALGGHLKWVSKGLEDYFRDRSKELKEEEDPVERVYISYLFESVFDWPPTKFHLHLHLIPRFQSFGSLLRKTPRSSIDAYQIATLTKRAEFPDRYLMSKKRITDLMKWFERREQ